MNNTSITLANLWTNDDHSDGTTGNSMTDMGWTLALAILSFHAINPSPIGLMVLVSLLCFPQAVWTQIYHSMSQHTAIAIVSPIIVFVVYWVHGLLLLVQAPRGSPVYIPGTDSKNLPP